MTKKDFELIAYLIRDMRTRNEATQGYSTSIDSHDLATEFADRLECANPKFNRDRFLKATGTLVHF